MKIDINLDEAKRRLTLKEKVSIKILLAIFYILFPAVYSHQVDKFFTELDELMKD